MGYIHGCRIMYRDLKPENLLVDEEGHVRLIDMGLAARYCDKNPTRTSRVGTDCYMAPEVRWCRRKREPYGVSCDWYTVGVLLYEFSNGALPFTQRDQEKPTYREGQWTSPQNKSLCESLLEQDWTKRIGSKNGAAEIETTRSSRRSTGRCSRWATASARSTRTGRRRTRRRTLEIDWDIEPVQIPDEGVKGVPKKKKDKVQAQRTAGPSLRPRRRQPTPIAWCRVRRDDVDYVCRRRLRRSTCSRCSSAFVDLIGFGSCRRLRAGRGWGIASCIIFAWSHSSFFIRLSHNPAQP